MIALMIVCGALVTLAVISFGVAMAEDSKKMAQTRLTLAEETDYEIKHHGGRP